MTFSAQDDNGGHIKRVIAFLSAICLISNIIYNLFKTIHHIFGSTNIHCIFIDINIHCIFIAIL